MTTIGSSGIRALAVATGALAAALAGSPGGATAGEVAIFDQGVVPAPTDLARILWPGESAAPAAEPVRTRGIRFTKKGEETASATAPSSASEPRAFGFLVRFGFDSADVLPESRPYLDSVGGMLGLPEAAGKRVAIVGHTDASGPERYNQALSERRAAAVRRYLEAKFGIEPERLRVVGRGEAAPIAGTDPAEPRNRRVEFHAAE